MARVNSLTVQHGKEAWPTLSTCCSLDDDPQSDDSEALDDNLRVDHTSGAYHVPRTEPGLRICQGGGQKGSLSSHGVGNPAR